MNILCLCDAGEVRSVGMAIILRELGHFAVAGSYDNYITKYHSYETDFNLIIEMQEGGEHFIGRDEWGDPHHPELRIKCFELLRKIKVI